MRQIKLALIAAIAVVTGMIFAFDLHQLLTLESIKLHQESLIEYYRSAPTQSLLIFCSIYVMCTALSLPGALILTLTGGALFGTWVGGVAALVSATIGAILALLASRFILRSSLEARYQETLKTVNKGVKEGAFNYLLFLRLVPIFPFFMINLVVGLTRIPIRTFALASAIGMAPSTFVFTNAASQLAMIQNPGDILSRNMLLAFGLLGGIAILPIIIKKFNSKP